MKRILIVEDEALIAAEIEAALRSLGYAIAGKARNGDKALDLLASSSPDLALLDINIKGTMSGIDLAHIIRQTYHFPFVYLTAYADLATLNEVKATMPYGYIVKPFSDQDLQSNIELALHKFDMERGPTFPSIEQLNARFAIDLSRREYEILHHLNQGLTYKEISEQIFLSVNTVKSYQKSLFAKLAVSSRHEAIAKVNAR